MPSTLLGFDFGFKRIGTAVGQTITSTARPLKTLAADQGEPDWVELEKLVKEWHPQALVVGIPLKMDDSEQFTTIAAKQFAEALKTRFNLPVYEVDERLSTKEARQRVFDQGGYQALQTSEIDNIAAQIILEQWMNRHEQ